MNNCKNCFIDEKMHEEVNKLKKLYDLIPCKQFEPLEIRCPSCHTTSNEHNEGCCLNKLTLKEKGCGKVIDIFDDIAVLKCGMRHNYNNEIELCQSCSPNSSIDESCSKLSEDTEPDEMSKEKDLETRDSPSNSGSFIKGDLK